MTKTKEFKLFPFFLITGTEVENFSCLFIYGSFMESLFHLL